MSTLIAVTESLLLMQLSFLVHRRSGGPNFAVFGIERAQDTGSAASNSASRAGEGPLRANERPVFAAAVPPAARHATTSRAVCASGRAVSPAATAAELSTRKKP